jgi:hypothetical protein
VTSNPMLSMARVLTPRPSARSLPARLPR